MRCTKPTDVTNSNQALAQTAATGHSHEPRQTSHSSTCAAHPPPCKWPFSKQASMNKTSSSASISHRPTRAALSRSASITRKPAPTQLRQMPPAPPRPPPPHQTHSPPTTKPTRNMRQGDPPQTEEAPTRIFLVTATKPSAPISNRSQPMLDLESWVVTNMSRAQKKNASPMSCTARSITCSRSNTPIRRKAARPTSWSASCSSTTRQKKSKPSCGATASAQAKPLASWRSYTADYKLYNSDILQPEDIGLRLLIFSGSHPGDDA